MMQSPMFRGQATERLSSPDQLDRLMRVTSSKGWLALLAVGLLVLASGVWSVFGSISSSVRAQGVFLPSGGTYTIPAPSSGIVDDLRVQRGDHVAQGQAVALLQTGVGSTVEVKSPFSGFVVELLTTYGDFVSPGQPLVDFLSDEEPLELFVYLPAPATEGIRAGMQAQISPSSVNRQEFGFMKGRVQHVAQFPSTERGMQALINNSSLVQQLFRASGGIPLEIQVAPTKSETPSGWSWSIGQGPPQKITPGTLASADLILRTQRPLSLVFPNLG